MKKGLSLFLSLIMVMGVFLSVPVTVNAASIDDLTFELNEEGTMYQVVDCDYKASGKMVIPEFYNGLPVTKIGSSAFESCHELTSVEIPDSVTNIGWGAFAYSDSLESILIPDSVTSIGGRAFRNCTSLTSITIPDSVTSIGDDAFRGCTSLTSIKLSKNFKEINWYTFYGCESLTSISIPDGVEVIGSYAFYDCKSLTTVTIPDSVTSIRAYTFYGCSSLKSITIPDSVWLGDNAFGYKYNSWEEKTEKIEGFTIYGVKGSEAEEYAKENAFAFVNICEHKTTEWITEKKATANSAGKKVKKCTKCGEVFETAEIPQLKCSKPKLSKIENTTSGVKITWGKVSGADKYDVYRKTGSGSYKKIGTTSKTYYTDKKASSGKKYYYYVKAVNEAGASSASSSKSILYLADTTLSTPKSTKSGITLKWKKVTGADGYLVYRKTGSGSYSKIATVKGNSKVTYTDKKAKKGKTYTYKIKAYKSKTYSAYSNTKKIKDKY